MPRQKASLGILSKPRVYDYADERRALLKKWAADPWEFLIGQDVDGRPLIVTKDESDDKEPYKAFPVDKPHLLLMTRDLFGPDKIVLVDKSRQMMVSTLCCLLLLHHVLFRRGRRCFISKQKEELAVMLMADKIRGPYERMPEWIKRLFPVKGPANTFAVETTESVITAVAQNAAVGEFRGNTASIVLIDEAGFQEYFPDMLRAAERMAGRMWAVTTANAGNPGAELFDRLRREQ